ncbi:MAG: type II toxin-antitoxin system RelE/ParE family toxin [Ignavibacteriales bacterium]|nr:type II toxin-antitoxin system RelE/ParE family toxin [Ignavibacteriales bacterium]
MKIIYKKRALKELAIIPSELRIPIEEFIFDVLPGLNNIYKSKKIEQLKGYHNFFKVLIGNYRIGLRKEGENIILERILHRKEIYKYFP